jgi:regulator of replication initiation timing
MFEQLAQISVLLANLRENIKIVVHENDQLRQEIEKLKSKKD